MKKPRVDQGFFEEYAKKRSFVILLVLGWFPEFFEFKGCGGVFY